jgi:hypothetical protein
MRDIDVLIFGSGSLARAVVLACAGYPNVDMSMMVVGRGHAVSASLARLARARAAALDTHLVISCAECDYSEDGLDRLLCGVRPKIILVLASRQSPWTMSARWRQLIETIGYGFTLPLQAIVADAIFRRARRAYPKAHFVNGCYPDMVNALLVRRGMSVIGGIGNVAILAAALRTCYPGHTIRVLAHHAHIAALVRRQWNGLPKPILWLDDQRTPYDFATSAETVVLPADDSLNSVTGAAAIPMLRALAGRTEPWDGHVPGVNGQLGGYPTRVDTNGFLIALPHDMGLEEAVGLNETFSEFDGVTIEDGTYRCTKTPDEIERTTGIRVPESLMTWRADILEEQAARLESFRDTL